MKYILYLVCVLFAVTSIAAFVLTVYDKAAAKAGKRRISEKCLLLTGLFGGATVMYITMKTVRHKTKHKKFMILLPVMILLHIIIIIAVATVL